MLLWLNHDRATLIRYDQIVRKIHLFKNKAIAFTTFFIDRVYLTEGLLIPCQQIADMIILIHLQNSAHPSTDRQIRILNISHIWEDLNKITFFSAFCELMIPLFQ